MRVGALEETITVSGLTPLVDVQNTTQHRAVTRALLDELPTGRQCGNYAGPHPRRGLEPTGCRREHHWYGGRRESQCVDSREHRGASLAWAAPRRALASSITDRAGDRDRYLRRRRGRRSPRCARQRHLQARRQPVHDLLNVGFGGPIKRDRIWFYGSWTGPSRTSCG